MGHMHQPDHRVTPLKSSDLQYRYPTGPLAGDDPRKRGTPDSSLLNRRQWYEVLYYINRFANLYGAGGREVALKAERMLHQVVPSSLRSHANIDAWLTRHWDQYPRI